MMHCPSSISPVVRVLLDGPIACIDFSSSLMPNDVDGFVVQRNLLVRVATCVAIRSDLQAQAAARTFCEPANELPPTMASLI